MVRMKWHEMVGRRGCAHAAVVSCVAAIARDGMLLVVVDAGHTIVYNPTGY